MKCLLVHNHYMQPGGEDTVFLAEKALLKDYKHEVLEYIEENKRIEGMSALTAATKTLWSISSMRRIFQMLDRNWVDVAHFHNTFLLVSPSAYHACRKAGVPVIQTLHNYRLLCPGALLFRDGKVCEECLGKKISVSGVLHACYRKSHTQTGVVAAMLVLHSLLGTWQNKVDAYIALTEYAKKKFITGGLPEEKIYVKPNFVHPDPGVRENAGDYVLFIGRLTPEKGLITLMNAWQAMRSVPLLIAGNGPMMKEMKLFIEKHNLERIKILGQCSRDNVFELLKNARFLIFPSEWYEGFPMTIIEAFACGLPVIAADLGSTSEIVEEGRTGMLFKPGDQNNLADKAAWLWFHEDEARRMGIEARLEFEAKYTERHNYRKLMEIYDAAILSNQKRDD